MQDQCKSFYKYKAVYEPRCGCKACWDKYFTSHLGNFVAAKIGLEKLGRNAVTRSRGLVFTKQLERYIKEHHNPEFEDWFRKTYIEGQNAVAQQAGSDGGSDTGSSNAVEAEAEVSAG